MIRRLRRRMTAMVIAVLVLVSAGIVLAIHFANEQSITRQAKETLNVLEENGGSLPVPGNAGMEEETPPPLPDGETAPRTDEGTPPPKPTGDGWQGGRERQNFRWRGIQALGNNSRETVAGLSNYYTVTLDAEGNVESWEADRAEQYTDAQIRETCDAELADGRDSGKVGTQHYRWIDADGTRKLVVLDARMQYLSAGNMLRSTILVASAACALLSLLAWLLIRRMVKPVEEAFARQKQFVSDASHELKTPLAVISANAEVLEGEIGENEYLGYIRSEVNRTDALVQNLLTLARMDQGSVKAEMKPFDLSRAVLDVTLPFESTVFESGKTMETDVPEGITCIGDEAMIKQLVVILLSNALKYSDDHGTIRVSLQAKGKQRELSVFNTGEPISEEDQAHVFDRFWRADASHHRETGGHGLGLSIARTIVEAHRGRIQVSSGEGTGTTFTVTLG